MTEELSTYMRPALSGTVTGQCPCCLKQHRVVTSGRLVRHGWKESGRQVGMFGHGFQWGACNGWGKRPLEQTDADAQVILVQLAKHLAETQDELEKHEAGLAPAYEDEFERTPRSDRAAERDPELAKERLETLERCYSAALSAHGLAFVAETVWRDPARRSRYGNSSRIQAVHYRVQVPQGRAETPIMSDELGGVADPYSGNRVVLTIKSYETMRLANVAHLRELRGKLLAQDRAIRVAVLNHFEHPSTGGKDKRRGLARHWSYTYLLHESRCRPGMTEAQRTRTGYGCSVKHSGTEDVTQVTCARCLKAIAARAAKDA